jgi:hypothetical protein
MELAREQDGKLTGVSSKTLVSVGWSHYVRRKLTQTLPWNRICERRLHIFSTRIVAEIKEEALP